VDDGDLSGTNHFAYTGSWTTCGGCNSGAYNDSFRYSGTVGSQAILTFTGTQATLSGYKEQWGGIGSASVDGGAAVDVNLYSASQVLTALYTTPILPSGPHTLTWTVTGRSTSGNGTINIDKADVYTSGGVPVTSTPTTPTTSTTTTTSSSNPGGGAGGAMLSFSFDDSQQGQYDNARPVLHQNGYLGTYYVISDSFGWSDHFTPAEAKTLAGEGDEIGNHTRDHPDLTSLSAADAEKEFTDSQSVIKSASGVTPATCAYPMGRTNGTVSGIAAKYFKACRGTNGGQNGANPDLYNLVVYYVHSDTTGADVTSAINQAKASKAWVILVYHGVGSVLSDEDVSPSTFASHVAAVKASGVTVKTVSGALTALGH